MEMELVWEFDNDSAWQRYDDDVQAKIREAKAANYPQVRVSDRHILDFEQERQFHKDDHSKWRGVQMVSVPSKRSASLHGGRRRRAEKIDPCATGLLEQALHAFQALYCAGEDHGDPAANMPIVERIDLLDPPRGPGRPPHVVKAMLPVVMPMPVPQTYRWPDRERDANLQGEPEAVPSMLTIHGQPPAQVRQLFERQFPIPDEVTARPLAEAPPPPVDTIREATPIPEKLQWEFASDRSAWNPYSMEVNAQINEAHLAGQAQVQVPPNHIINFTEMRQFNRSDLARWRGVRCRPVPDVGGLGGA